MKSKWLGGLVITLIIINIIDIITAKRILVGEANPIYVLTKSYLAILLAKVFFAGLIIYLYFRSSKMGNKTLFFIIMIMVYASLAMAIGVYSNVSVSDETLQQVATQRQEWETTNNTVAIQQMDKQLVNDYTQFAIGVVYFPIIFGLISFIIWERVRREYHETTRYNK